MKKCLALLGFILACFGVSNAQTGTDDSKSVVEKPARDFVMVQLTYDMWMNKPDSINTSGFNRGVGIFLCYDFPIKKSNFSFAAGLGVSASNIYLKNQEITLADTGTAGGAVGFVAESRDYKRYKMSTAYIEAPFELRYFGNMANRNKGFKAAVGLHVGTLVGAGTKANYTVEGTKMVDKQNAKRYLESWKFQGTARIGWGNFSIFGGYNLNTLFKEGQGPGITPVSVGLVITGL